MLLLLLLLRCSGMIISIGTGYVITRYEELCYLPPFPAFGGASRLLAETSDVGDPETSGRVLTGIIRHSEGRINRYRVPEEDLIPLKLSHLISLYRSMNLAILRGELLAISLVDPALRRRITVTSLTPRQVQYSICREARQIPELSESNIT